LELTAPPGLSVVCFRYVRGAGPSAPRRAGPLGPADHGGSEEEPAALNRVLLERLQLGGEAFLTSTELRGRYTLRACIVNYRSRREDVDRMLEAAIGIGRDLVKSRAAGA